MKKTIFSWKKSTLVLAMLGTGIGYSQVQKDTIRSLEDVVVTGVVSPRAKIKSSVSISSVNIEQINQAAPRSTAEIFRSIAGIKSESTGGEGNANITVRGIPIASGGAKFLQIQEDGLPVMQFGDVAFGNTDIFIRNDNTLRRIEAIRGGSASTMASNAPGGIINFISKDGKTEGGSLMQQFGLDYGNFRTDYEYGSPLTESLRFHVGGFYRQGEGPRTAGYTANQGGQFKANLTKDFKNGYVRMYFKHLDDKSIGYLPMPMKVTGTDGSPTWGSVDGFNASHDTPHSALFMDNLTIGSNGERRRSNVADGMRPIATSFGAEMKFDLENGWKVEDKFRQNLHSGRFVAPIPASVEKAGAVATSFGEANLTYANGAMAGQAFDNNKYVMKIHLFDTEINNFNNFSNDIKLTKKFDKIDVTVGYFKGFQNINMSWLWNSYLMEVKGDNAALLNAGAKTVNGLFAYGVPGWGNCCQRNYDANYDMSAPYAALQVQASDKVSIDASIRYDMGKARGTYAGTVQSANLDVDNNGVISGPETSVSIVDNANRKPINYDYNYLSYSIGANFLMSENQSIFGRISRGGRGNADRLLFGGNVLPSGEAIAGLKADMVDQMELGFKNKGAKHTANATFFYSNTAEQNWDFNGAGGGLREIQRKYNAMGLELEGTYRVNALNVGGSVTWTKSKIATDVTTPVLEGNKPRRQADFIYNVNADFKAADFNFGVSLIGTTSAFAQDDNKLVMPAYFYVNPSITYNFTKGLSAAINMNNAFDALGITEVEEGSITPNVDNIVRARAINGRTTGLTVSYKF